MAAANVLAGKSLLILVGAGDGPPETFAHPCLINTDRGITINADTNDSRIPDCSDPELLSWLGREKISLSATISGAGTLHTTLTEEYFNWVTSASTKNVRVSLNGVTATLGGGYFAGAFHLVSFEITGSLGEKVQCALSMVSDGTVTWTDAS